MYNEFTMTKFEVTIILFGMLLLAVNQIILNLRVEKSQKRASFHFSNLSDKLSEAIVAILGLAKDQQEIKTRLTWIKKRDNKTLKTVKKIVKNKTKSKNVKKK